MDNEQPTTPPALPIQHKKILALSVRGDSVWEISEPVLHWMIEHGDEELRKKALFSLGNWELSQGWFIQWGNQTRYFELAELACRDLAKFKQMIKTFPADNPGVQRIIELALMTGEQFNRPIGISRKNILKQRKQSRGKRR